MSQAALTARLYRERKAAERAMRAEMGLDDAMTPAQVKALLAQKKAAEDAEKTELQKEREARQRFEREAAEERARREKLENQHFVERTASAAGFKGKASVLNVELGEWVAQQIDDGKIAPDDDLTDTHMASFFADLRKESPGYFGTGGNGNGAETARTSTTGGDGGTSGRRAATSAGTWDARQHNSTENRARAEELKAKYRR